MHQHTNSTGGPKQKGPSTLTTLAILGAFALFLSTIEFMIPKPLPYLRIGLANLPLLVSLYILPVPQIFLLVLLKVLGQGLVNGTLFSYIFLLSLFGSFSSGAVMVLLSRRWTTGNRGNRISFVGISVLGALASNSSQIVLSSFFVFGEGAWFIAPPFLTVGLVTSLVLGFFTRRFCSRSTWYKTKLKEHTQ
jgi:heptaprenyl diphosphate synthase